MITSKTSSRLLPAMSSPATWVMTRPGRSAACDVAWVPARTSLIETWFFSSVSSSPTEPSCVKTTAISPSGLADAGGLRAGAEAGRDAGAGAGAGAGALIGSSSDTSMETLANSAALPAKRNSSGRSGCAMITSKTSSRLLPAMSSPATCVMTSPGWSEGCWVA